MADDGERDSGVSRNASGPGDRPDRVKSAVEMAREKAQFQETIVMQSAELLKKLKIQSIPKSEFSELSDLISNSFGIKVGENKRTLVTGRVHPMMDKYGFANHRDFLEAIKNDKSGQLLSELANRISTNHTAFYREDGHFKLLANKVLPAIVERKNARGDKDLRVWCAACATGEEAYTILFTLMRHFGYSYSSWRAGVLATDISADALATARRGVYAAQRVEPIPKDVINTFFDRVDRDSYEVKPEYRQEVTFRRLNLIKDSYPFKQKFDIIFCRNVMIYFSRPTRTELIGKLHDWLVPGGYLFIGHSESLVGTWKGYDYIAPAVYCRND
ncbi:MAG: chemotaxis protein CheR [Planctomycetes bacterium]|nr:chemotaxis protein CheR [Planctomycetota bacterium]